MNKLKQSPITKVISVNRLALMGVMVLMFIIFTVLTPILRGSSFLQMEKMFSALSYAYFIGFLALGVTFVISTSGIDFSIGPVMFAAGLIAGYSLTNYGMPVGISIIISILVGAAFGLLNGWFVAYRGIPSFITSLASMQLAKGIGSVFTKTQSVTWPTTADGAANGVKLLVRVGNIPTGLICLIVVAVICAIILNKTKAGRYMLFIGSNREAVRLSGINTKKWEMLAYIISGTLAGIAALFYVGAYTTVLPGKGDTFNNEAIAACVMGGTSMTGGIASIFGTILGALTIALMQEGILAMGFTISYQYVLTGLIVLVAVTADVTSRKRKN